MPFKQYPFVALLVEDNQLTRKTLCDMLERLGGTVHEAATVEEAVSMYIKHFRSINLILFDGEVAAPVDKTVTLVRNLVEDGFQGTMVAISGGDPSNNQRLIAAGCKQALPKPISLKSLMALLEELDGAGLLTKKPAEEQ